MARRAGALLLGLLLAGAPAPPAAAGRAPAPPRVARPSVARSALGRALRALPGARAAGRQGRILQGRLTLAADRLQERAGRGGRLRHRVAARTIGAVRLSSPLTMGGFLAQKIKQDPIFLGTFGTAKLAWRYAQVPIFLALGAGTAATAIAAFATGLPLNLAVVLAREHQRRPDRSQSFGQTVRGLGRQYVAYAEARRARNRAAVGAPAPAQAAEESAAAARSRIAPMLSP